MAILNVTPDSFYDGGRYDRLDAARARAEVEAASGAAILDIGGESTRPGAAPVDLEEEWRRIGPVLAALASLGPALSIDTRRAEIARRALDSGAEIVNDVSAGEEAGMFEAAAGAGAGMILMHKKGEPATMQDAPRYEDARSEVAEYLSARVGAARSMGIEEDRIAIDPGIGFGKRLEDNLSLLAHPEDLFSLGRVVCLGASRKSFLSSLGAGINPEDRLAGSLAVAALWTARACAYGAALVLRVHDTAETSRALAIAAALSPPRPAADPAGAGVGR